MKHFFSAIATASQMRSAIEAGADAVAIDFRPGSKVSLVSSRTGTLPDRAHRSFAEVPQVERVGEFQDEMMQNVVTRIYNFSLDGVVLYGQEPAEYLQNLRRTIVPDIRPALAIVKAITLSTAADLLKADEYAAADALLFRPAPSKGLSSAREETAESSECSVSSENSELSENPALTESSPPSATAHFLRLLQLYRGPRPFVVGGLPAESLPELLQMKLPLLEGIETQLAPKT